MIIEFNVGNFLSIKTVQPLRLSIPKEKLNKGDNTVKICDRDVERIALMYGPNSSGKSNFIKAIRFSQELITKGQSEIRFKPYIDKAGNIFKKEKPYFEFVFNINDSIYSYGFELNLDSDEKIIFDSEWLYVETEERTETVIENDYSDSPSEYLSLYSDHESGYRKKAFDWVRWSLIVKTSHQDRRFIYNVCDDFIDHLKDNLDRYDTGITDVKQVVQQNDAHINRTRTYFYGKDWVNDKTNNIIGYVDDGGSRKKSVLFYYDRLEDKWSTIKFTHDKKNLSEIGQESAGTLSIIQILSIMSNQKYSYESKFEPTAIIDELECSIHTLIVMDIIKTFLEDEKHNQLIATTHETRLLNQIENNGIWFVDTDGRGDNDNTVISPLWSYKVEHKNIIRTYLNGGYLATPLFTNYYLEGIQR